MKLSEFFKIENDIKKCEFARGIQISNSFLYQIEKDIKKCPATLCHRIEEKTGGLVCRTDLRPHDWHLIWPELVDAKPIKGKREKNGGRS